MARMPAGVTLRGKMLPEYRSILTPEALAFLAELHRKFDPERQRLLGIRAARAKRFSKGVLPDFLPETRSIREGTWRVAPIPADLQDRRVEITGPTDRKMVINALNSGAKIFMGKVFPTLHACAELGRMHVKAGNLPFPEIPRF